MQQKEYTNEKGEIIPIERWAWCATYLPSEAQIKAAEARRIERNEAYDREVVLREKAFRESGKPEEVVERMKARYAKKKAAPEIPAYTELHQFDKDGKFHLIGEVDQSRLKMFSVYKPTDPTKRIDLPIVEGMKIIYKYKNVHAYYFDKLGDTVKVYVAGYKSGGAHSFLFILPDDRIIFSDREDVDLVRFNLTKPKK